jgi:RimJ/RimL family protein N-acetyltransferase
VKNIFLYTGKTVVLRSLQPSDADLIYSWMQEDFFYYYKPYLKNICPTVSSLAGRIETMNSLDNPFEIEALILHNASRVPIGLISLSNIDTINSKAEISVAFHRGFGTRCVAETLYVLFNYVFSTMQLNKLYFYVTSDNEKILKNIQKYDFVPEGKLLKEVLSEKGEWLDLFRFCMLRQDWQQSALCNRLKSICVASE